MARPWTAGWIKSNVSDAAEYFIDSDYYDLQARVAQLESELSQWRNGSAQVNGRLLARIEELEAALRTANEDFKACWIATGNPEALAALKRTEVALELTPETSAKCKCSVNDAQPDHTCPYRQDINDDNKTLCNCCDSCQQNCADDI